MKVKYAITIINTNTFSARALVTNHYETVEEYEGTLGDDEMMIVTTLEIDDTGRITTS